MSRLPFSPVGLAVLLAAGCASLQPDARVREAMDLVEARTSRRPEWTVPWDQAPPLWDGQTVLRLEEALGMALRNNRELRGDLEMIGQANADLVQAGLLQNPTFNFMMMFPSGGGRSMLRSGALPMQPLQDLWLIPARQQVAQAELQQAVLRVADRAVETTAAVKKVYARLQYTQRAIALIRENALVVEQSTQIIQTRQAVGRATQVQVNLSRIRHLRLQSELLAMQAEHRSAQRELLMLMGLAAATDGWRVEPIHEIEEPLDAPLEEEALVKLVADHRLDLKASEWRLEAAERRIDLTRREGWPDLALGLTFERAPAVRSQNPRLAGTLGNAAAQGIVDGLAGMAEPAPPMVEPFAPKMREVKYALGPMIEMEIPIFDRNQAQVAKAVHEYRQRRAEYEARVQEITRMVRETLVMQRQAHDQVRFYREEMLPAVERNLTLAQQAYVAGEEDLTVYLDVQEDLLMTRLKTLAFVRDYLVTGAELEREVGGQMIIPTATSQPAATQAANQP